MKQLKITETAWLSAKLFSKTFQSIYITRGASHHLIFIWCCHLKLIINNVTAKQITFSVRWGLLTVLVGYEGHGNTFRVWERMGGRLCHSDNNHFSQRLLPVLYQFSDPERYRIIDWDHYCPCPCFGEQKSGGKTIWARDCMGGCM